MYAEREQELQGEHCCVLLKAGARGLNSVDQRLDQLLQRTLLKELALRQEQLQVALLCRGGLGTQAHRGEGGEGFTWTHLRASSLSSASLELRGRGPEASPALSNHARELLQQTVNKVSERIYGFSPENGGVIPSQLNLLRQQ